MVELFVLLQKNVLRLKIAMDDVRLVAVVDARKDLLQENSCVSLSEFSTVQYFIEKFATFADPKCANQSVRYMIQKSI